MDLPDTGGRTEFETGAVRDSSAGKGHYSSIPPIALKKLAIRFEDGARKYSNHNWMKGINLSAYLNSLNRHIQAWAEGDESEDHGGAILWNSAAMIQTLQWISEKKLPSSLDDRAYLESNLAKIQNRI